MIRTCEVTGHPAIGETFDRLSPFSRITIALAIFVAASRLGSSGTSKERAVVLSAEGACNACFSVEVVETLSLEDIMEGSCEDTSNIVNAYG